LSSNHGEKGSLPSSALLGGNSFRFELDKDVGCRKGCTCCDVVGPRAVRIFGNPANEETTIISLADPDLCDYSATRSQDLVVGWETDIPSDILPRQSDPATGKAVGLRLISSVQNGKNDTVSRDLVVESSELMWNELKVILDRFLRRRRKDRDPTPKQPDPTESTILDTTKGLGDEIEHASTVDNINSMD